MGDARGGAGLVTHANDQRGAHLARELEDPRADVCRRRRGRGRYRARGARDPSRLRRRGERRYSDRCWPATRRSPPRKPQPPAPQRGHRARTAAVAFLTRSRASRHRASPSPPPSTSRHTASAARSIDASAAHAVSQGSSRALGRLVLGSGLRILGGRFGWCPRRPGAAQEPFRRRRRAADATAGGASRSRIRLRVFLVSGRASDASRPFTASGPNAKSAWRSSASALASWSCGDPDGV